MLDHITFGVAEFDRAIAFYDQALAPLGVKRLMSVTADRATVDAFHKAALAAGGQDNGAPGVRAHYHPSYYGAFVLDPEGRNIEAVCHAPG